MGSVSTTLARRKIAAVSVKATEPDSRTEATNPAGQTEDTEEGDTLGSMRVLLPSSRPIQHRCSTVGARAPGNAAKDPRIR
ncbi:hypothetical protein SRHO_G00104950 [Serrasalmus rhombeus]